MSSDLREVAEGLRRARLSAGLTLTEVGAAVGVGRSTVSRTELAGGCAPRLDVLARHAATVGLRARVQLYPGNEPLRDAGQLALMSRLRASVGPVGTWAVEVPVAGASDRRAIDAVLSLPGGRIGLEWITRLTDGQAQIRDITLKQRDARLERMVLVVLASSRNRRALRTLAPAVGEAFPVATRSILRDLRGGRLPPGNGIVLL